jgi:hypothetical protein
LAVEVVLGIENRIGALAEVTSILTRAGLTVEGVTLGRHPDGNNMRFVVSEPKRALALLREHGYEARLREVAALHVDNEPGAINRAADLLAKRGINIEAVYIAAKSSTRVQLIFQVDDVEGARKALKAAEEE